MPKESYRTTPRRDAYVIIVRHIGAAQSTLLPCIPPFGSKRVHLRMAAACLRRVVLQAGRQGSCCLGFSSPAWQQSPVGSLWRLAGQPRGILPGPAWSRAARPLTTASSDEEEEGRTAKKKQDPRARKTVGSVGRKIHHRVVRVISELGEDLGPLHRADVIRIMDQRELKLVPLRENEEPPVYRLMTGKQIHEEQLKLRERQKAQPAPTQVKELTLSSDIARRDLDTKVKQIQSWVEKKLHVKVTVRKGSPAAEIAELEGVLEQVAQHLAGVATFISKPKAIKDGKAAMGTLRALSRAELSKLKSQEKQQLLLKEQDQVPETLTKDPQDKVLQS
ncbi:translation initiation factor IF-3, mitochondrial [Lepisosteus oculatus]|uniref:translation initiation factor IF-3, mitochondrial n=1 Tax=Lepisosteus oculatus TaxID=7918 RepID=UPI00371B249A